MVLRIYLSASIANARVNSRLKASLAGAVDLVLPQDFTPDVEHTHLPRAIYSACIAEMERCDGAIVLLDALGVDCAMECGWLAAKKKPLVGIAGSSLQFTRHWMVKGCLTGLITLDPIVEAAVREDPILRAVPVKAAAGWGQVAAALLEVLQLPT